MKPEADPVVRPDYYTDGAIETWDFIAAKGLDYFLGNAVKYISRAGKKNPQAYGEDLRKAMQYLAKALLLHEGTK